LETRPLRNLRGLAFRNLKTRKTRTLLTTLGIVLGVAVILAISVTNQSTLSSINTIFDEASGLAHLVVAPSSYTGTSGFPESTLSRVQSVPGIAQAVPTLQVRTLLARDAAGWKFEFGIGGATGGNDLLVFGIDPERDPQARLYKLDSGRFLEPGETSYSALFTTDYADEKSISLDEDVDILLPNGNIATLRAVGFLRKDGPGLMNSGSVAFVPLDVLQDIFARGGELDQIDIVAQPSVAGSADKLADLKQRLEDKLGSKYVVNYPAQRGQVVTQQLATYQQGLSFFSMIALFVGGFLIYNAFAMTIVERTQEIGLLRALGLTRRQVTRLILIEASVLGVIGSILGVGFGLIMARGMMALMSAITATEIIEVTVPLDGLLISLVVGLGVTLVSAFLPAFKAGRISPLAALRIQGQENPTGAPRRLALRFAAGVEMVAVAVLTINYVPLRSSVVFQIGSGMVFVMFLGATLIVPAAVQPLEKLFRPILIAIFGAQGRLGSSNIERSRGRAALTVAALMTGIAMVISIGAMGRSFQTDIDGWVNSAVGGDLLVRSPVPMRIDFGSRLGAIPGVAAVTPARYFGVQRASDGDDLALVFQAIDPATYFKVASFQYAEDKEDAAQIERDLASGQLLVSTTVADRYDLKRGDTLELETRRGVQSFRVAGLVSDFTSQGYVINGTLDTMRLYFGVTDVDRFTLKLVPGADRAAVQKAIEDKYGQSRHVQVETTEEFRTRIRELTNRAFGLLDVLANIGVLVAALGVINTMMMNVLERQREIGSLRSIGMTRSQIVHMILAEAGAMGAVGAVFGIGFGILLSRVLVQGMQQMSGYRLTFSLPFEAVLNGILIAFLVSQIAALYPAWRASRVNIVEAIKHE